MRFRPRFKLRTLFVLIAIVSIPMGWVAYHLNWIRQRREIIGHRYLVPHSAPIDDPERIHEERFPFLLKLLGEEPYLDLMVVADSDEARANELFPEAEVMSYSAFYGPTEQQSNQ